MASLFTRFSLFVLGGTLVASLVSGDVTPLIVAMVAIFILWIAFKSLSGSGGA